LLSVHVRLGTLEENRIMRAHRGLLLALALSSFLLIPLPASAQPIKQGVQLDRGLTQIESGQPVPLRNRPMPSRGGRLDRNTGRAEAAAPRDYVAPSEFGVILEFDGSRAELEAAGIRVGTQTGRIFTARVRRAEIGRLRGLSGMRRVQLARYMQPHLNVSRVDVRADLENGGSGSPPVYGGRAGQGIIIGDVDTGIDFTRPDFQDSTGKTRILYIWDQNDTGGPGPSGFGYGSEWTKSQIDNTPGSIRHQDTNGHGTNVAGVLIGNGSETGCSQPAYRYVGMAPRAEFIEVATDFSDAGIIDGVNYIFQKAAALGKDCVVNLSLGGQAGPHDGSDDFSTSISALTGPGRIVVASSGNEQEDPIHGKLTTTSTTLGVDKFGFNIPLYTKNTGAGNDYILIAGWYDPAASVVIQVKGPLSADTMSCGFGAWKERSTGTGGFQIYIANQYATDGFGGTAKARQFEIQIWDATVNQRPAPGNWTINVVSNGAASIGKRVDIWIYVAQLGSLGKVPVVTTGLDNTTLVNQPADGDSLFAVAAHVTKPSWYTCLSGMTYSFSPMPTMNAIAPFSSVGPRRDGVLKPEISAPGFGVATTHSSFAGSLAGTGWDVDDGVHEISSGTSFSAPHVAGAAALYLQANPGASPSRVKLAFMANARADAFTGVVPNSTWGYGKLDIYATLDHVAPAVAVTVPNTSVAWKAGSTHAITWTATDNTGVTAVDLAYSTDGGVSYPNVIATGLANSGSYSWSVPNTPSSTARVRATAHDAAGNVASDASDVNFTIDRWTITASAGPGGNIAPVGLVPVVEGANQKFSIQPVGGNHVQDVLVDGLSVGSDTTYTFTGVTADHTIAASFSADLFTLTSTAAVGGAVTRAPDLTGYAYGTEVTVTAVPDSGWAFTGWSGDTTTTGNPLALLMIASRTVAAAFADTAPPPVHVLAPVGGTIVTIGDQAGLTWNAFDNAAVARVDLYVSRTGAGGAFDSIATAVPNTGSYDWLVTGPATVDAFLKVVARDSAGNVGADVGDSSFVIRAATGVGDRPVADFELAPMQPNPLRGVGRIGFALPRASHVRLSVIDVQGREVAVLAEGVFEAGRHQARWEGASSGRVGPGLYFVRLSVANRSLVRRTVVTR
jgi:subtilisin family serine protease